MSVTLVCCGVQFPDGTIQCTSGTNLLITCISSLGSCVCPCIVYPCMYNCLIIGNYDVYTSYTICSPTSCVCQCSNCIIVCIPNLACIGTINCIYMNGRIICQCVLGGPPCQVAYTTTGAYTFTVPAGVFCISAVAIGAGGVGGGVNGPCCWYCQGGYGAGTGWVANRSVSPGQTLCICVGCASSSGANGSFIICCGGVMVCGQGGCGYGCLYGSCSCYTGDGGGCGGAAIGYANAGGTGGGGAGGYTGNGGCSGSAGYPGGNGTGGGGGGGCGNIGGGVGIYGLGCNGFGACSCGNNCSVGCPGSTCCVGSTECTFGGGGTGALWSLGGCGGAVRIIWGQAGGICRAYCCCNTKPNC